MAHSVPTNGEVLENLQKFGLSDAISWLMDIWVVDERVQKTPQSVSSAVKQVKNKCSLLKKNKRPGGQEALEAFCKTPFKFPIPRTTKRSTPAPRDRLDPVVLMDLCKELQKKTEVLTEEREGLSEEIARLQEKLSQLQVTLKEKCRLLRNATDREYYHRRKIRCLEQTLQAESDDDVDEEELREEESAIESDIDHVIQKLDGYKTVYEENLELKEELKYMKESFAASKILETYNSETSSFTPAFRELVDKLLSLHISSTNISSTINAVLEFAGLRCERLPARATVSEWNVERLAMAQIQLAEELPSQSDTTLYSDVTTKFGQRYMGYHLSGADGRFWVLGLRDIPSKSSVDCLSTFKEILGDLDDCVASNQAGKDILLRIRSTMSDRAATESKFVELLELYRREVLATVLEGCDDLSEDAKTATAKLHMFFCGLHSLIQYAETSIAAIAECEKAENVPSLCSDCIIKAGEPGTLHLLRTAAKAFARGGDDQSGKYFEFNDFCVDFFTEHNVKTMPLKLFRGNRFNSVFYEAEYVFFLHEKMLEFLHQCPEKNQLLCAVLADLSVPSFIAGLKALGLLSKLVIGPLWRLLEDSQVHILDMNQHYTQLYNFLLSASECVGDFMLGDFSPFPDLVKKDCYLRSLVEPCAEYDEMVASRLCVIFPALAMVIGKQCQEHLPGGQYSLSDGSDVRKQFAGVGKHSKFSESAFAYMDNLLRYKPHIGTLGSESYIMFALNKTADWLAAKSEKEKCTLIKAAMKMTSTLKQQYAERCKMVSQKRREQQQLKWEAEQKRKAAVLKAKEELTNDIIHYGLWRSPGDVDRALDDLPTKKEKIAALKVQLKFRQQVLQQQSPDKSVYAFSGAGKPHSVEKLAANLKTLDLGFQSAFSVEPQGDLSEGREDGNPALRL
ncbi:uncharacterized protein LOC132873624 [Neoarius graeffei]|uniref:uncharacterized protein LOC132873624 n=1 Tax=Neoarius graeffei TaxID=443677 RepID=UPI00298C243B|nr:uncharacterized protein LOC132873624 [Neoarius graeffei]